MQRWKDEHNKAVIWFSGIPVECENANNCCSQLACCHEGHMKWEPEQHLVQDWVYRTNTGEFIGVISGDRLITYWWHDFFFKGNVAGQLSDDSADHSFWNSGVLAVSEQVWGLLFKLKGQRDLWTATMGRKPVNPVAFVLLEMQVRSLNKTSQAGLS